MRVARRLLGLAALLSLGSVARTASAEPSSTQRAAAEALFRKAAELMDEKRFNEACDKFQASQELDPTLGTMLYLADCYDRAGRSASAWALFQTASQKARHDGQPDRERIAKERADELEARLSLLSLTVDAARQAPGLEVSVGGAAVPSASFNTPLPFDPGPTRVEARAAGYEPWSTEVTLTKGPSTLAVKIPALKALPKAPAASTHARSSEAKHSGSSQGTIGVITGAVGLAVLGVAGYFGYRAYDLNRQSKAQCRAEDRNACTPAGVGLRDDARTAGTLSTVATTSGALLVAGGFVIVLTAPSDAAAPEGRHADGTGPATTTRAAAFDTRGFGLALGGVF